MKSEILPVVPSAFARLWKKREREGEGGREGGRDVTSKRERHVSKPAKD